MTTVEETIPDALQPEVEAALAWFNQREGIAFEVTGILDPQVALEASGSRDLHLILCGGDRCERRSFRVTESGSGYDVAAVEDDPALEIEGRAPARLDPPPAADGSIAFSLSMLSSFLSFIAGFGDHLVAPSCGAT